jgi:exodeoxyribonuclease VII small subunit
MEPNLTYESAFEELTAITQDIETGTVSVDLLAEKVRRASALIAFCQAKLRDTEAEVTRIIDGLNKPQES